MVQNSQNMRSWLKVTQLNATANPDDAAAQRMFQEASDKYGPHLEQCDRWQSRSMNEITGLELWG